MDDETNLLIAERLLEAHGRDFTHPEPHRLDVLVDASELVPSVRMLSMTEWGTLAAITGLDLGAEAGEFEVLYHFCAGKAVATLRVRLPRSAAAIPSICAVIPSAGVFERELSEMFGITVEGVPDPRRLFLPDDWPDGAFPLRKDFALESEAKNAQR